MKKFLYLLIVFVVLWLAKLSYDNYLISNQLVDIKTDLHQAEQRNASLNDQLIGLQRTAIPDNTSHSKSISPDQKAGDHSLLNPSQLLKQQLKLVQFALEQQQYVYALEQLNQFDFNVEAYDIAETLKNALHQAVEQDRKAIQGYVLARNVKIEQLNGLLVQIEQQLNEEENNVDLKVYSNTTDSFWQKWFKVDFVDRQSTALINRKLILKEVQLRLLSAQQSLLRGQFLEYQKILKLIVSELNTLPDQNSQQLKKKVQTLQQVQMQPILKLNTAAILE
ncbi:hypothetical protein [Acinetobacter sp. KS-LM10]|uniref:hypothetical protein n=1 Tax=Acinetobacter sp. KS-LM10 TaxID=3120518 RepID=UPI0030D03D39